MNTRLKKGDMVPFVQVSNEILYNRELSLKSKGLYAFMLSKPDNWHFTTRSMATQLKESRRAVMSAINELKEFGLLEYKYLPSGGGEYIIYASVTKRDHGNETHRIRNASDTKRDRISNNNIPSNKEIISNTLVRDFRKAIISTGHVGRLETVYVEQVLEDVYLDDRGHLYTPTRSTKQLVSSTIGEIWNQLYDINESKKRAIPERAIAL